MLIGVVIDSIGNHDYLAREDSGLLFCNKRTMEKLHGTKGLDSLQQKLKKLVMCILDLFLNLMLGIDENLSEGCFFKFS